ncbi:MAG: hypothetical protein EOO59_05985 [Hymenobacter sp.]|nr:MAG: hypothetical protein EOO59_05985 [Hymenobacter sp.]
MKNFHFATAFIACLLLALTSHAQAPGSGGPTPGATTDVPLDGGASLLLASGVAYGLRRLRTRRSK